MNTLKVIPDVVQEGNVIEMQADINIRAVARLMAKKNIAAVVINDDSGCLMGIVTERDLTRRVLADDLNPDSTSIGDVMTSNPDSISADASAMDALELMDERRYRHLPVVRDGRCIAMVSIRDLYRCVREALEEDIRETKAFVFGDRYGG